jgi:predicted permease
MVTRVLAYLRQIARRHHVSDEIDDELAFHLELEIEAHMARGLSPVEARRVALRDLGGLLQTREAMRDVRMTWLDDIGRDVRFAMRQMRRTPVFTIIAVSMLAVGIGVNTAVFTLTNAALFQGFPHVDPENRVVYISSPAPGAANCCVSYADFDDWRSRATAFDGLALVSTGGLRLRLKDQVGLSETYDATQVSSGAFTILGHRPLLGRDFEPADEAPGAAPVAILNYRLWEQRYHKDPAIIGRTVDLLANRPGDRLYVPSRINTAPTTLIGVMPADFDFPHHQVDLWMPLARSVAFQPRDARLHWFAFGRLRSGFTLNAARGEMEAIGRQLERAYPKTNRGVLPSVLTFHEFFLGRDSTLFYGAMWGAVTFVLLIACANLANLLLARSMGRSREMAVRIALGAGRWRVMRQLLIESVTLSTIGGALGWVVARCAVRAYEVFANPPSSYNQWTYTVDSHVFAYVAAISVGTGIIFGLAPARQHLSLDVNTRLKNGSRETDGYGRRILAPSLVVAEVTLAVVLLAGAGVMIRSALKVYAADLGVRTDHMLTVSVWPRPEKYPSAEEQAAFFERMRVRMEGIPGVESAALANALPARGTGRLPYEVTGAPLVEGTQRPTTSIMVISSGYFRTMGANVVSGRAFGNTDDRSAPPVVMVNQRFAATVWPREDPLGKRLRLFDGTTPESWRTVVGVVSNIVQNGPVGLSFDPIVYVPTGQKAGQATIALVRTHVTPDTLIPIVRRELLALDADLVMGSGLGSVDGPKSLAESLVFNYGPRVTNGILFVIFAGVALLLAAAGLYAVVAHLASQRTQEIGVRLALGATPRDILSLVFWQGMWPVGVGLGVGLLATLIIMPVLKSQLIGVQPTDPTSLIVTTIVILAAAMLGCWIPANRATKVDPMVALRCE